MSQTKTFAVSTDTVRRQKSDGTLKTGCGQSKHLYAGRLNGYDYRSFVKFATDWTNVGRIVSATLNLYTDDYDTIGPSSEPGLFPTPASGDLPTITIELLTAAFTVGSSTDGQFVAADFQEPARDTTTGVVTKVMTPNGTSLLHTIDITEIVKAWAPSTVEGGGRRTNHGIAIMATHWTESERWSGWSSKHSNAAERPSITLVYEYGGTVPNTPTSLTPSGSVGSLAQFEGNFSDVRTTDTLQSTDVEVYDAGTAATATAATDLIASTAHGLLADAPIYFSAVGTSGLTAFTPYYISATGLTANAFSVSTTVGGAVFDITADSAVTWTKLVGSLSQVASQSDIVAAHFIVPKPSTLAIFATRTYRWRARVHDQEGQVSAWTALTSFTLTNTAPGNPTLSPVSGSSYASLNLVKFSGGTFSDADGDTLNSYQVQMSPYAQGDIRWDSPDGIVWDSGQVFVAYGDTSWETTYGGRALSAGTYYWRARQWDSRLGVSSWVYAQIVLTASFSPDPGSYTAVQVQVKPPWRIVIRDLFQADGVTPTTGRGPGNVIAVLEEAKGVGASIVYNSPGELHFTLLKDDPQLPVIEPKQTHYAVEFYSGDGWQEKYAGVIWDVDATEVDAVFKGIDYLALYDTVLDERYDPLKPQQSYAAGGSYYANVSIKNIILDQLNRAKGLANSWVGFINIGTIDAMDEMVTVYSTMQPVLGFVSGLIDSHRQGTGKRTRIKVSKTTGGTYELTITDDPGTIRSDLALYYGELVQGYRVIVFGDGWANVQHVVGRDVNGAKVTYNTVQGQAFQPDQSVYGRIATVSVFDGVNDQNDLARRGMQAAIQHAKLGKQIAIGLRTQFLSPLQGWDITDIFPVTIQDGPIDTTRFGSGYWSAMAAAWEVTDLGQQNLIITLLPREDTTAPNSDLLVTSPISTQREWQLGWVPPTPLNATSLYYLDQSAGIIYQQQSDGTYIAINNDPRTNNDLSNSGFQITPIATLLNKTWTAAADWATALSTVNLATGGTELTMTTSTY